MTDDCTSLVDHAASACLCDQGGGPYVACVLVAADGRRDLVLVDWEHLGDTACTYNHICPAAPHEWDDGPLPPDYAARLAAVPYRCGRRTQAGGRCRIPVSSPGQACAWHRTPRPEEAPW